MNNTKGIVAAIILALGMGLLGQRVGVGIVRAKKENRTVSVRGLSEREVAADKVIWPMVYKEVGNNLNEIYRTINRKNDIIVSFLKGKGIDESEISIAAPQIIDQQAERYNNMTVPYRYNVTSVITVSSSKVDLVRQLLVEQVSLLENGVAIVSGDYEYRTQFLFTGLNELKPSMIADATKNARASAEQFAKDSDSKLGKIQTAYQGQFSIENRDANTPYLKTVRVVSTIVYYLED